VSTSFGAKKLKVHAAGKYTVRLAANATAKRALSSGKTLHVRETIVFTPAAGGKPIVKTFTVTVHGKKSHNKH
jgi:VCBS repeat-containing protein